ncbi:MAG TPA: hypothetical protein VF426_04005 [Marmoricola sp.]
MLPERLRSAAAAAVLGAALLATTACGNPVHLITGGNAIDDYCAALNSHQRQFADMTSQNSPVALLDARSMFKSLADKAPDDMTDDWQTLLLALDGLQKALDHAGVKASDYVDGKPPSTLSTAERKVIAVAADQLSAQSTVNAVDAIDQEARDVCKINLGL